MKISDIDSDDLHDAFEYVSETFEQDLNPADFVYTYVPEMPIEDLYNYDDIDPWLDYENGELLTWDEEDIGQLSTFRPKAVDWIRTGKMPPIIIIDSDSKNVSAIADGRGRVNIAIGMGWETIPAIIVKDKGSVTQLGEPKKKKKMLGYKVMNFVSGRAVSMADSRQSFVPQIGDIIEFNFPGIWLSLSKQYVLDYYAGNDMNILLTFEFDPKHVIEGNITDRETEFTVLEATLVDYSVFEGGN